MHLHDRAGTFASIYILIKRFKKTSCGLSAHLKENLKNPTMTKIVLLWLLSKTIVNISYYIVGQVPRTILVPCD